MGLTGFEVDIQREVNGALATEDSGGGEADAGGRPRAGHERDAVAGFAVHRRSVAAGG